MTTAVEAQNSSDVLRYSLEYPSYDPVTMVMPAIGTHTGFGTYQDNPAAMALANNGYMSFSLSSRYVDESATYLSNVSDFSDTQTSVGDLGFVYKFPTTRGSLVIGGGYSQSTNYNRAFSVDAHNNESTLTDLYSFRGAPDSYQADLNEAAFNAFAIEDVTSDSSTSIFRFGLPYSEYPGINQNVEFIEKGQLGEYSAFIATEAMRNLFVGASIGLKSGTYSLRRDFYETDQQGDYDGQIIDSDGDGDFETDIDEIYSTYTIDATIEAFSAQLGLVYQPTEQFNIGASYEFPSRLQVEEEYNTIITTTFDNGDIAEEEAPGGFSYEIVRPQRLKGGVTYSNGDFIISALAEGVFYTNGRIDFEERDLRSDEDDIKNFIESNFKDVVNFRGGVEYQINNKFTPRVGYGYFPSPTRGFDSSRQFVSGGFSATFNQNMTFNLGLQYSFWEDENSLYEYEASDGNVYEERVQEDVTRLNVMAGIKIAL